MSHDDSQMPRPSGLKQFIFDLTRSRTFTRFINFPPVAWITKKITRLFVRASGLGVRQTQEITALTTTSASTLEGIIDNVVKALGYVGAMVATYEQGDVLPVRAFYIDPVLATLEQIREWELQASNLTGLKLSITDPKIARVYLYDARDSANLSVRAVEEGKPVISDSLFDLFTPIAPDSVRPFLNGIQEALGIKQVIAVPFFINVVSDNQDMHGRRELVGNLFAARRELITEPDIVLLSAFARQAALLIENQRRQAQMNLIQKLIYDIQVGLQDEKRLLQRIVDGVVQDLGYVGAMLATREAGEALPVRAYHVDPAVVTAQQIHEWEDRLGARIGDEATARVYINQLQYKSNLSVLAAEIGKPVTSDFLFDLFTPIVPDVARPVVMGLQEALGIQHVIAVPFFLETRVDGGLQRELVGNLFAATRSRRFSASEIEILTQFGNQAAAGIRNARLYRLSEERRNVALIFARMAFSAAANVHDLRNHVAVVKTPLSMLEFVGKATQPEMREKALTGALEMLPNARDRIQVITELLDSLHEPWRHVTDKEISINQSLREALGKVYRSGGLPQHLEEDYTEPLPDVRLSPDMLIEAFRIVIKNAMEAMQYQPEDLRYLKVETCLDETRQFIMIKIRDSGRGIAPENLSKVFEMRWSTKSYGMGFGLFWAKDFIEGLGGSIQVDSRPDEGAAFIFRIPVQPVTINAITE